MFFVLIQYWIFQTVKKQMSAEINQLKNEMQDKEEEQNKS